MVFFIQVFIILHIIIRKCDRRDLNRHKGLQGCNDIAGSANEGQAALCACLHDRRLRHLLRDLCVRQESGRQEVLEKHSKRNKADVREAPANVLACSSIVGLCKILLFLGAGSRS